MKPLGFYIVPHQGRQIRYFVQRSEHARRKSHVQAVQQVIAIIEMSDGRRLTTFNGGDASITPVYESSECPLYVIRKDLYGGMGVFYTSWMPGSPIALEADADGRERFKVVEFVASIEDADSIVQLMRNG